MHVHLLLVACFIGWALAESVMNTCPDSQAIRPCTCRPFYDGSCVITCSSVHQGHLEKLADVPDLCYGNVRLTLVNSGVVRGIPARLWRTLLSSKTVDVSIQHSNIDGIVPPGSEDIGRVHTEGNAVIKFGRSTVGVFDWTQLRDFTAGEFSIIIDDVYMPELDRNFTSIAGERVHKVSIDDTELSELPDGIFAPLDLLQSLSLQNNYLVEVSRSMFPRPAEKLRYFHLNGNKLKTIPGDLFADMPALQMVYLRDNQLTTLPQDLFSFISAKRLYNIDFVHNPWVCDCRLMWILGSTNQHVNMGLCSSPNSLADKKVKDLPKLLSCK